MANINQIITHYDFDGIVSAMLLAEHHEVSSSRVMFFHPDESKASIVRADQNTVVCDLPYFPDAGEWFDHHLSNFREEITVPGKREEEKSCARVITRYLGIEEKYPVLVEETDRIDSADLQLEDVLNPKDYILLSRIVGSNYKAQEDIKFNRHLLDLLRTNDVTDILNDGLVKGRVDDYRAYMEKAKKCVEAACKCVGDVIVTDLRSAPLEIRLDSIRYLPYALNPDLPLGMIMFCPSYSPDEVYFAVGYNLFNPESKINIGELMKSVGGGGHVPVGGTKVPIEKSEEVYATIMAGLNKGLA